MLCPNCKKEIENDSKFCEHCGERVKKSKKWLWVALAVTLLVGGAIVVWDNIAQNSDYIVSLEDTSGTFQQTAEDYRIKLDLANQGFIDLGLPSGTLWKNANEGGDNARYTYDEAVRMCGNKLPTNEQLVELKDKCTWTWTGSGYQVIGPNGNSIYLPAAGYRDCDGDVYGVGTYGRYWSSSSGDSDYAWYLYFNPSEVRMGNYFRCRGSSVRLVQNP